MKPVLLIRNDLFFEILHEKVKVKLMAAKEDDEAKTFKESDFWCNHQENNSGENVDNFKK